MYIFVQSHFCSAENLRPDSTLFCAVPQYWVGFGLVHIERFCSRSREYQINLFLLD